MKFSLENIFNLRQLIRHLSAGLRRLDLVQNFESFEVTLVIPASSELKFRNQLNFIPTRSILVNQRGNGLVTQGDTAWTRDFLYMKNNGAEEVVATYIFMR